MISTQFWMIHRIDADHSITVEKLKMMSALKNVCRSKQVRRKIPLIVNNVSFVVVVFRKAKQYKSRIELKISPILCRGKLRLLVSSLLLPNFKNRYIEENDHDNDENKRCNELLPYTS